MFTRYALRRPALLAAALLTGFIVGIIYRLRMDPTGERYLANYLRSGLHGAGLGLSIWAVQTGFASTARSSFGAALRRLSVAGEVLIRSLVMTTALVMVGVSLQFLLYAEPYGLSWLRVDWFTTTLPRIVAIGFAMSLIASDDGPAGAVCVRSEAAVTPRL